MGINPGQLGKAAESDEWYTPPEIVDEVRLLFDGAIDLDPASCAEANRIVQAVKIYTREDDGLSLESPWHGRVFNNPPYSGVARWVDKNLHERARGVCQEAVLLTNAATETGWAQKLLAHPVCFVRRRIVFWGPNDGDSPVTGSMLTYLGDRTSEFAARFRKFGHVVAPFESACGHEGLYVASDGFRRCITCGQAKGRAW